MIWEGPVDDGKSPIEEDRSSSFSSGIVSTALPLPTGCRSRRKSIQGWTRYRELYRERFSSVLISTTPMAVCAWKTCPDVLRTVNKGPSLKLRHGSFIRCPTNDGTGSSWSRSYNLMIEVKLSRELCNLEMALSISARSRGAGMCDIGS